MTPGNTTPGSFPVDTPGNTPGDSPSSTPLPCCGLLRCKTVYYRPDERPGKLHESDTAMHWCLKTHQPLGPDDKDAKPSLCQAGRACFQHGTE